MERGSERERERGKRKRGERERERERGRERERQHKLSFSHKQTPYSTHKVLAYLAAGKEMDQHFLWCARITRLITGVWLASNNVYTCIHIIQLCMYMCVYCSFMCVCVCVYTTDTPWPDQQPASFHFHLCRPSGVPSKRKRSLYSLYSVSEQFLKEACLE